MKTLTDRKIYVVGGQKHYANWMNGELVHKMENADLVVFTGGEDIYPGIYGENLHHPRTSYNIERDSFEVDQYSRAIHLKKKIIGICRGHQLISALNGSKIIQDQGNPGTHLMETHYGYNITINSLHHQAVFPFDLKPEKYNILGWTENLSSHHQDGAQKEMNPPVEIEMIHFPETNCLGIQCHPEMLFYSKTINSELTMKFFRTELNRFMIDTLFIDKVANNKLKSNQLITV